MEEIFFVSMFLVEAHRLTICTVNTFPQIISSKRYLLIIIDSNYTSVNNETKQWLKCKMISLLTKRININVTVWKNPSQAQAQGTALCFVHVNTIINFYFHWRNFFGLTNFKTKMKKKRKWHLRLQPTVPCVGNEKVTTAVHIYLIPRFFSRHIQQLKKFAIRSCVLCGEHWYTSGTLLIFGKSHTVNN